MKMADGPTAGYAGKCFGDAGRLCDIAPAAKEGFVKENMAPLQWDVEYVLIAGLLTTRKRR